VEAAYNANMPFKWNATRIQVLPNQNAGRPGSSGMPVSAGPSVTTTTTLNAHAFSSAPPANMAHPPPPPRLNQPPPAQPHQQQRNEAAFGTGNRGDHGGHPQRTNDAPNNASLHSNALRNSTTSSSPPVRDLKSGGRSSNDHRRRDERSNTRDRSKTSRSSPPPTSSTRKRSRSPPRRTHSPSRSRSPPRRRQRTAPRYNVSVPKVSLNFLESSVYELKKRYSNMYVPSDYFMANHSWMKSFPIHDGFKIQYASTFHIFNKDLVESPLLSDAVYDPSDANHTFSAKVMLMAVPPSDELIEKTCQLAESSTLKIYSDIFYLFLSHPSHSILGATNRDNLVHPTRAIQFLVGTRGKNETLAIGGPWSPSLDGPNPESDPSVLIRTAIRVCRSLTGIDLSHCTQWHGFLEIHFRFAARILY
jgi:hypothetical protein